MNNFIIDFSKMNIICVVMLVCCSNAEHKRFLMTKMILYCSNFVKCWLGQEFRFGLDS